MKFVREECESIINKMDGHHHKPTSTQNNRGEKLCSQCRKEEIFQSSMVVLKVNINECVRFIGETKRWGRVRKKRHSGTEKHETKL